MTFNIEEKHAVAGAGAAMSVPTLANLAGLEQLLVDLSDKVFEGERGSAAFVAGVGFAFVGSALVLSAILTDLDDLTGMAAIGLGVGAIGLSIESFNEARR